MNKHAVISLSGGMDSSSLLLRLLREGKTVTALSFDYGQKHRVELERATELVSYLNQAGWFHQYDHIEGGMDRRFPLIKHQIIKLDGLSSLLNSALVEGGDDVPEGHYENENMKDTVVPNRNKIFSSIIQAVALSKAEEFEEGVDIAMGIHAGDHAIYPDCRQEFRDADYEAFLAGNYDMAGEVRMYTPYLSGDKYDILEDGVISCTALNIDFDDVYRRTMTSYKPITHLVEPHEEGSYHKATGLSQGWYKWYSDYKSASSVERVEAFLKLGRPDPAAYADETGPVSWETVVKHVESVLAGA